jgi:23S rRNA pseudouridine1911/1915/1917 synthase
VGAAEDGLRLDVFLAAALGVSRARARRALGAGGVRLDGKPVGPEAKGRTLRETQVVEAPETRHPAAERPIAEPDVLLDVLAEGPGWVAVDKPAGMPVHPLAVEEAGTVLNALAARRPEMVGVGEAGLRSGVVHRLDVATSGALLFATEQERWEFLRNAFRRHRVRKLYRALVHGRLEGEGDLDFRLAVGRHRPARVRVVAPDDPAFLGRSRPVRASYRTVEAFEDATLVEVRPKTGFLHQIRVSLAHLGHPVVGDASYGGDPAAAPRHLLHAAAVSYSDVEAASPDPEDLRTLLEALRHHGSLSRCAS